MTVHYEIAVVPPTTGRKVVFAIQAMKHQILQARRGDLNLEMFGGLRPESPTVGSTRLNPWSLAAPNPKT